MCTYNGEKYIREQIDTILAQTYPILELIIQDDGSSDSTPSICREYAAKYPNVLFFQNGENLGYNENFRTACLKAHGDFIAISDQDDVWLKEKIEMQVNMIGTNDLCYSDNMVGTSQGNSRYRHRRGNQFAVLFYCPLGHTFLMPRSFAQDPANWSGFRDYDWSLAVHANLQHGSVGIEKALVWHRRHQNSATSNVLSTLKVKQNNKLMPYINGYACYKLIFSSKDHQEFYHSIHEATSSERFKTVHQMSYLLLHPSFCSWIRLGMLCAKYRRLIYEDPSKVRGLGGLLRGFFFISIYSYWSIYHPSSK